MVAPPSWDVRMMAVHSAEIAELPKANPLRLFHLFWRFALGSQRRKVLCPSRSRLRTESPGSWVKLPSLSRSMPFSARQYWRPIPSVAPAVDAIAGVVV
jgi:hypothetical protein